MLIGKTKTKTEWTDFGVVTKNGDGVLTQWWVTLRGSEYRESIAHAEDVIISAFDSSEPDQTIVSVVSEMDVMSVTVELHPRLVRS